MTDDEIRRIVEHYNSLLEAGFIIHQGGDAVKDAEEFVQIAMNNETVDLCRRRLDGTLAEYSYLRIKP